MKSDRLTTTKSPTFYEIFWLSPPRGKTQWKALWSGDCWNNALSIGSPIVKAALAELGAMELILEHTGWADPYRVDCSKVVEIRTSKLGAASVE